MQARLKEEQDLALFVHCTAHRLNLVVQDCLDGIRPLRDSIHEVAGIIRFFRDSNTRQCCLANFGAESTLRPLCPTRWTCSEEALSSVTRNYDAIRAALDSIAEDRSTRPEVSTLASGFHRRMGTFDFLFGLELSLHLLRMTTPVMRAFQGRSQTLAANLKLAQALRDAVQAQRDQFDSFWLRAVETARKLGVGEPTLPRRSRPPRRLDDGAEPHQPATPADRYRPLYLEATDRLCAALDERYSGTGDEQTLLAMERALLEADSAAIDQLALKYKTLDADRLRLHCQMLHDIATTRQMPLRTLDDVVLAMRSPELGQLLPEAVQLLRLHMTCPATTCTAERSFSQLRRLKSWLRATMSQRRLNHVAVCAVYAEKLYKLSRRDLLKEFVGRSTERLNVFGRL